MMKKITIITFCSLFFIFLVYETLKAFDDGIVNLTRRRGNTEGCTCHSLNPFSGVSVIISGPSSVRANDTVEYRLKISGGPLIRAGCDISAANGLVIVSPADTMLQRLLASANVYELTHVWPKLPAADTVTFIFRYIAPNTPGSFDTLYANGNSVNFNGTPDGDEWNYASDKIISITSSINVRNISSIAKNFSLEQNYPNPFNPSTSIRYSLGKKSFVSIKIFDLSGKEIGDLVKANQNEGIYEVSLNALKFNMSSGVYFYRIMTDEFTSIRKMILIK